MKIYTGELPWTISIYIGKGDSTYKAKEIQFMPEPGDLPQECANRIAEMVMGMLSRSEQSPAA